MLDYGSFATGQIGWGYNKEYIMIYIYNIYIYNIYNISIYQHEQYDNYLGVSENDGDP